MRLATDARALRYSGLFSKDTIDVVPSETVRGRIAIVAGPHRARCSATGTVVALNLVRRLKPAAVVGFGGYPTVPPLMAARLLRRARHHPRGQRGARPRQPFPVAPRQRDRDLAARRARSRSGSSPAKATTVGTPMRPAIPAAAAVNIRIARTERSAALAGGRRQPGRARDEPISCPARSSVWSRRCGTDWSLTQQVREEDMARVRAVYDRLKINAELAPFFSDLPARLASSHLVISRSGAGTVAELAAIGRPSILVPLPGAIDQDQFANAGVLTQANGALAHCAGGIHA